MLEARIRFKPEFAEHFIDNWHPGQEVTYVQFASVEEFIETMKEMESFINNAVVRHEGRTIAANPTGKI